MAGKWAGGSWGWGGFMVGVQIGDFHVSLCWWCFGRCLVCCDDGFGIIIRDEHRLGTKRDMGHVCYMFDIVFVLLSRFVVWKEEIIYVGELMFAWLILGFHGFACVVIKKREGRLGHGGVNLRDEWLFIREETSLHRNNFCPNLICLCGMQWISESKCWMENLREETWLPWMKALLTFLVSSKIFRNTKLAG